jgi:hypothetical protein
MSAQCAVAGVGLFTPRFANWAAFREARPGLLTESEAQTARVQPTGALLDKHARRRASDLTKALSDAYQEALEQAGFAPATVSAVFGSALGEASITIGLLDQLWRGPGALSPMRFAASVHNAASGVVSIGTKNMGFTTALGADHDTPAMALLEGMAFVLSHGIPAIVVCGDEAAPVNLVSGDEGWDFLTCAIALAPLDSAAPSWPRISAPSPGVGGVTAVATWPRQLAQNPVVGLLDLIAALEDGEHTEVRLDRGRGRGFGTRIVRPA